MNRNSNKTNERFASVGFRGSMTTIRPNTARKVHHNRFEGDLARCSIYDLSNNKILSDESVVNGGTYELIYYQGIYILDEAIPMSESRIDLPKIQEATVRLSKEVASLKANINPESFPRFYVWRSNQVSSIDHKPLTFNEITYNDGEMYDAESGKATAEYDGMYTFSTSLFKNPSSGNVYFLIHVNDEGYSKSGS